MGFYPRSLCPIDAGVPGLNQYDYRVNPVILLCKLKGKKQD